MFGATAWLSAELRNYPLWRVIILGLLCSTCAPFDLAERTDRKLSILYRQNEMQETLCYLFPIDRRLPKLNVAGSIPVSRSNELPVCPKVR